MFDDKGGEGMGAEMPVDNGSGGVYQLLDIGIAGAEDVFVLGVEYPGG